MEIFNKFKKSKDEESNCKVLGFSVRNKKKQQHNVGQRPTVQRADPNNECSQCGLSRHHWPDLRFWRSPCGHIVCPRCYETFFSIVTNECRICGTRLIGSDFQREPRRQLDPASIDPSHVTNRPNSGQNQEYYGAVPSSNQAGPSAPADLRDPYTPPRNPYSSTVQYNYGYPTPNSVAQERFEPPPAFNLGSPFTSQAGSRASWLMRNSPSYPPNIPADFSQYSAGSAMAHAGSSEASREIQFSSGYEQNPESNSRAVWLYQYQPHIYSSPVPTARSSGIYNSQLDQAQPNIVQGAAPQELGNIGRVQSDDETYTMGRDLAEPSPYPPIQPTPVYSEWTNGPFVRPHTVPPPTSGINPFIHTSDSCPFKGNPMVTGRTAQCPCPKLEFARPNRSELEE